MKKLTLLLAVVAIFACLASVSVFADDTMYTATTVYVNQPFYGTLTDGYDDTDYVKFTISQKGDVHIGGNWECYDDYGGSLMISLYESDGYLIDYWMFYTGEYSDPMYLTLEAGTYYIEVWSAYNVYYDITVDYAAVGGSYYGNSYSNSVVVSIPTFPITINGTRKDNSYAKYPYIVYNNITYCPMTYYGSSFLGLSTNWSAASGLTISKLPGRGSGIDDTTTQYAMNYGAYYAEKATGPITVNGKYINNSTEQYPILVFRDVTYFPLTWRFAVEEFGWNYSYTDYAGLVINN